VHQVGFTLHNYIEVKGQQNIKIKQRKDNLLVENPNKNYKNKQISKYHWTKETNAERS
jgi:hypothetical protein